MTAPPQPAARRSGRNVALAALATGALAAGVIAYLPASAGSAGSAGGVAVALGAGLAAFVAIVLPQGFLVAITGVAVWLAATGRGGLAALLLAAALPAVALLRRGALRCVPALAVALGLVGLAVAYPALAGQAARPRDRAVLGGLGYWWLVLAEVAAARRLWLGAPAAAWRPDAFAGSLTTTATHALAPLLTLQTAAGVAVWGAGALTLPWALRGASAALDAARAIVWALAVALGSYVAAGALAATSSGGTPRGWVLGALAAAAIAVIARGLRAPG